MSLFAYDEFMTRLRACPKLYFHNPMPHTCPDPEWNSTPYTCTDIVEGINPPNSVSQPLEVLEEIKTDTLKNILRKKYHEELKPNIKKEPGTYFFITINPHPEIKLLDFINKIKIYIKSILFEDHLAVIEQRGTLYADNLGKGFHAHILFKRKTLSEGLPPSNIESKCRRSFKNYTKKCSPCTTKIKCNHTLNFQTIGNTFAADKVEYLLGEKYLLGKPVKQEGDLEWREMNDIPTYFGNPNILSNHISQCLFTEKGVEFTEDVHTAKSVTESAESPVECAPTSLQLNRL